MKKKIRYRFKSIEDIRRFFLKVGEAHNSMLDKGDSDTESLKKVILDEYKENSINKMVDKDGDFADDIYEDYIFDVDFYDVDFSTDKTGNIKELNFIDYANMGIQMNLPIYLSLEANTTDKKTQKLLFGEQKKQSFEEIGDVINNYDKFLKSSVEKIATEYPKRYDDVESLSFLIRRAEMLQEDLKTKSDKKELKKMKRDIQKKYLELFPPQKKKSKFFSMFRNPEVEFKTMKQRIDVEKKTIEMAEKNITKIGDHIEKREIRKSSKELNEEAYEKMGYY